MPEHEFSEIPTTKLNYFDEDTRDEIRYGESSSPGYSAIDFSVYGKVDFVPDGYKIHREQLTIGSSRLQFLVLLIQFC